MIMPKCWGSQAHPNLSGLWGQRARFVRRLIQFLDPSSHFLCASGRFVRPLGGRGTSLAKRRLNDHARIGGAGAPPSQRPDYFHIDPEMELRLLMKNEIMFLG
jgi:hypothetical protein